MQDSWNKDEKFQIINNELEKGKQTIDLIIKGGLRVMEGTDNWKEITVYLKIGCLFPLHYWVQILSVLFGCNSYFKSILIDET